MHQAQHFSRPHQQHSLTCAVHTCGTQGRTGPDFDDRNEHVIQQLCRMHPNAISLEMETFQMLDLARCSKGECLGRGADKVWAGQLGGFRGLSSWA